MTRDEAIDKYEVFFEGLLINAWSEGRTGPAQAQFCRKIVPDVRKFLGLVFDEAMRHSAEEHRKLLPRDKSASGLFGDQPKKKGKHDVE